MKKEIKNKEQKIELKNELKFEEMDQVKGGNCWPVKHTLPSFN